MSKLILSVGHSPELLTTRALLLRSAGYTVEDETDVKRALIAALNEDHDLVVLCHTLASHEIDFFISNVRKNRPSLPVLCVRKHEFIRPNHECSSVDADPVQLLKEIYALLASYQ